MKLTIGMKIFGPVCLLALVFLAAPAASSSQTGRINSYREGYRSGEICVGLQSGVEIDEINARYGTYIKELIPGSTIYLLGLPPGRNMEKVVERMNADLDLLFAEFNQQLQLPEVRQTSHAFIDQVSHAFIDGQSPVNFYGQQSVENLCLAEAHEFSRGSGVRVAVIDTGLDFNHSLFAERIAWPIYDFVDDDGNPSDEQDGAASGHGTFVAGLIALTAPDAKIMPLRAFSSDGRGTSFDIARAIRFATDEGVDVINMSFGMLEDDKLIKDALKYARPRVYLVASAGNDNLNTIQFPADTVNFILSVTSTTTNDIKAPFANYNSKMYAAAPGVLLYSAYPGERWAWWSGTSFSTALVTGEAALLLSLNPSLKSENLNRIIILSGIDIDSLNPQYKNKLGRRIDYRAAIKMLLNSPQTY
jgi:thermitase